MVKLTMSEGPSERIIKQLSSKISALADLLSGKELRPKVLAVAEIFNDLMGLGKSLMGKNGSKGARDRILKYFQTYPGRVLKGEEIRVVSGIQEYARRIRELRVEFGWKIMSGLSVNAMSEAGEDLKLEMGPDDYILASVDQDREGAHRWNLANGIRKRKVGVREKILEYLKENVGNKISGEELQYLANNKTEWARRVRELRTEFGWPIVTRNTGRPDLPVGDYLLESKRQSPLHDRLIPDPIRGEVLKRDKYCCTKCGWNHKANNRSDPRHLELHHVKHHVKGGANDVVNLTTLCTVCHDQIHREK